MMKTPRSRAAETTWFIRGAISATRSAEPLHQCSFHMSQMAMAVFFGSHSTIFSVIVHSLVLDGEATRERVWNSSGWAEQIDHPRHTNNGGRIPRSAGRKGFIGKMIISDCPFAKPPRRFRRQLKSNYVAQ